MPQLQLLPFRTTAFKAIPAGRIVQYDAIAIA